MVGRIPELETPRGSASIPGRLLLPGIARFPGSVQQRLDVGLEVGSNAKPAEWIDQAVPGDGKPGTFGGPDRQDPGVRHEAG